MIDIYKNCDSRKAMVVANAEKQNSAEACQTEISSNSAPKFGHSRLVQTFFQRT